MTSTSPPHRGPKPYPAAWDRASEIRVLRAPAGEWTKVVAWRTDLARHGWKLVQLSSDDREITAVFGKTRHGSSS
jgi:hypothetical protein